MIESQTIRDIAQALAVEADELESARESLFSRLPADIPLREALAMLRANETRGRLVLTVEWEREDADSSIKWEVITRDTSYRAASLSALVRTYAAQHAPSETPERLERLLSLANERLDHAEDSGRQTRTRPGPARIEADPGPAADPSPGDAGA